MNQIYFVGYDAIHKNDFVYDVPNGFNSYLLVLTTTPAVFRINGIAKEYPAHTAILYPPNHSIYYGAANQEYGNHWIRFSSDELAIVHFPLQGIPFSVADPEYCHNIFQLLTWETSQLVGSSRIYHSTGNQLQSMDEQSLPVNNQSNPHELIISQLLHILFTKLGENVSTTTNTCHDRDLIALRRQIASNPQQQWTIADMADQLHVSSGYLQLIYKKKFNISCMDDVIHYRLVKAKDLLAHTNHSISEIALKCGYNNTEHFCRQFYKKTELTPGQYRKKAGS